MRRKMVVLKIFCSYWVRRGELTESPFWRVHLSYGRDTQLPRALTEAEMRELLAQAGREMQRTHVPERMQARETIRRPRLLETMELYVTWH
jgi:site-specific recombinase XerD